jgi:NAD(P)H-dependent flavin oxidoreductase YrpB (nitropropane dioxygenase family)
MTQHSSLSPERWASFSLDQQILMIGNEMNRAAKLMSEEDRPSRLRAYERILQLADLSIAVHVRHGLRRELLRWRDLVAALYVAPEADPGGHRAAFRALLLFTPAAARQIPLVLA